MPALATAKAEFVIDKGVAGLTVAVAEDCAWGLEVLVAVMVTDVLLATLGAVNSPLLEIVPALTDQVTPVFEDPLILAVNSLWACDVTFAVAGTTVTVVPEGLAPTTIRPEPELDAEVVATRFDGPGARVLLFSFAAISETFRVKLNVPAAVGMPEMEPVLELSCNPGGRLPWVILKL
jgi:hypothetical protein